MNEDRIRRLELGKMFIDIAKYVLTIVVIGGLFLDRLNVWAILMGAILATGLGTIGFLVIPLEENAK